jgi:hypothetical protein
MRAIREKLQLVLLILSFPFVVIACVLVSWLSIIIATIERLINPLSNPEQDEPLKEENATPKAS